MAITNKKLPLGLSIVWIIITFASYWPGLHGSFLFDDYANLPALGASGPIIQWPTFWRYITSGIADPTGRPLTMLTFLIDGHDWPTDPATFLRTNLIIHLLNGGLLFLLLDRLSRFLPFTGEAVTMRYRAAALLAAALWLIHPLFVSTVLYIVQREAMLPATFVLLGLLAWLHGRKLIDQDQPLKGNFWVLFGIGSCTLLGLLCKANGILLPVYVLVIEGLLASRSAPLLNIKNITTGKYQQPLYRSIFLLTAIVPTVLIIFYLAHEGYANTAHGISRPWTLPQRLMTEPRVVTQYLRLLWFPTPYTTGLFNDQVKASTSWLSPPTTLLCTLFLLTLCAAAWNLRRRFPVPVLAIAFYFAGQLLESTTVALEFYYEHRNYVPAMLMFWPLALWLCDVQLIAAPKKASAVPRAQHSQLIFGRVGIKGLRRFKPWLALAILIMLAIMTFARASLWGSGDDQALLWAKLNPGSPRAQANAATHEIALGLAAQAAQRLQPLADRFPSESQIVINLLNAHCATGGLQPQDHGRALYVLANMTQGEQLIFNWLGEAIAQSKSHACPGMTASFVSDMIDAAAKNPKLTQVHGPRQDLFYLRGELALSKNDSSAAVIWFEKAIQVSARPETAFEIIAELGSAHHPREALDVLAYYEARAGQQPEPGWGMPRIHQWVLRYQNYWPRELARLRANLQDDLQHTPKGASEQQSMPATR